MKHQLIRANPRNPCNPWLKTFPGCRQVQTRPLPLASRSFYPYDSARMQRSAPRAGRVGDFMQCVKPIYGVLFVFVLIAPAAVGGQDGPQRQPAPPREQARPQRQPPEPTEYDRKFFDQLRIVF